jgi:YesN/AraC family two-component response regulator
MKIFYYNYNEKKPMHSLETVKVTFYELSFVLDGEMTYYINNKKVTLNKGDILFLQPGLIRRRSKIQNCEYISYNYRIEDTNAHSFTLPLYITNGISAELLMILRAGNEIHFHHPYELELLEPILECLLQCILNNCKMEQISDIVKSIKEYVVHHIKEPITLEQISKSLFFSTVYCSSLFKKEMGISIIDYCLNEKIKLAKKLIIENVKLKSIAEQLGFSSYNYFSRTFKKREGITPMQYKQKFFMPSTRKYSQTKH